jgi:uncharacterized protein GlcG (DUF336 family)
VTRLYKSLRHIVAGFLVGALCALPAAAEEPLLAFDSLNPETALEIAQAALGSCRDDGYQVAVAVVDRSGIVQVLLRDRFAGPHTPETARRKAWTAVSFRSDTLSLAADMTPDSPQSGARFIDQALMIGGGIPIMVSGSLVGGVGISGGPSGTADHGCAQAGINAAIDELELASGN